MMSLSTLPSTSYVLSSMCDHPSLLMSASGSIAHSFDERTEPESSESIDRVLVKPVTFRTKASSTSAIVVGDMEVDNMDVVQEDVLSPLGLEIEVLEVVETSALVLELVSARPSLLRSFTELNDANRLVVA